MAPTEVQVRPVRKGRPDLLLSGAIHRWSLSGDEFNLGIWRAVKDLVETPRPRSLRSVFGRPC